MNLTELAWAAGLFDGEGSTCPAGRTRVDGHRPSLRMTLSQKNTGPELLLRFQHAVGEGRVKQRVDRPGVWTWTCIGEPCKNVLRLLSPFLSFPKLDQAEQVLEAQQNSRASSPQRRGHIRQQSWS